MTVVVTVVVKVSTLETAVVLKTAVVIQAAAILEAARVLMVVVVCLPGVDEAASYTVVLRTVVVHLRSPAVATVDMVFPTITPVQREGRNVRSSSKLDTLPGYVSHLRSTR